MSFTEEQYASLRPFLYHVSARANFERLARMKLLESAASLLNQTGRGDLLTAHRPCPVTLGLDGCEVVIRDQQPLHKGHIKFTDGWTLGRLIGHLNRHVFFWPQLATKADYGVRYFEHYAHEAPVILRAPFLSVAKANAPRHALFCRYNSGSPRTVDGQRSPRGAETFARAQACTFSPGRVAEVVYRDAAVLPPDTEWARTPKGPWFRLAESASRLDDAR